MIGRAMKTSMIWAGLAALALPLTTLAQEAEKPYANDRIWAKPLSNPVYNDTAMIKREVNILYAYQTLPSHIESMGLKLDLDGDLHAAALQFEIPITDYLAIVANKSGYVDFNPDNTLSEEDGYSDLAAGLKWALYSEEDMALAVRATYEIPMGDDDVFMGNGDGNISPAILATYFTGDNCFNGVFGMTIPIDNGEESTMSYISLSHAYRINDWLSSHVEINWWHVLDSGSGKADFDDNQGKNFLPSTLEFEGGDLINFGASNSDEHPDLVTFSIGARIQLCANSSLGMAYELPLTDKEHNLMSSRFSFHLTTTF